MKKTILLAGLIGLVPICNVKAEDSLYVCLPCEAGTYSDGTAAECANCPWDSYCPAGTGVPTACPSGKLSKLGSSKDVHCTSCPTGYQVKKVGTACPNGYREVTANSACPSGFSARAMGS